ncbi:hypothetical protein [Thalassoroseus pseudoceratinae]|uniref:hypothetical protein n=1 Tax=Thalassoroseus pseudoceratinae TaxID=2713176 RepID=UPI001420D8E7|nr:hypothetical protein [Thalassoroseus pseudoceratinae]
MSVLVHSVDRPETPAMKMPDRFRTDVIHFATPAGMFDAPDKLNNGEYWVRREDAQQAYDDGVLRVVSILDSENRTELELSEEQEIFLEWLLEHEVQHIRLESVR